MLFHHVDLKVTQFQASRAFYTALLAPIGHGLIREIGDRVAVFGPPGATLTSPEVLFLRRHERATGPLHLAFSFPDAETVDIAYQAALDAGGRDNGEPGPRPRYGAQYYGAFLLDPEGNNVEILVHPTIPRSTPVPLHLAVVGAGAVGGTLGARWAQLGHDVVFGVRDPESDKVQAALHRSGGKARAASVAEAITHGDVVLFATSHAVALELAETHASTLAGKVLVDVTNPLRFGAELTLSAEPCGAAQIAEKVPGAQVVKAFNTIGAEHMDDPRFGDRAAAMFIAGDSDAARASVRQLAEDLGFDVIEVGDLAKARHLEELALLWIHLALRGGQGRDVAFALLRK